MLEPRLIGIDGEGKKCKRGDVVECVEEGFGQLCTVAVRELLEKVSKEDTIQGHTQSKEGNCNGQCEAQVEHGHVGVTERRGGQRAVSRLRLHDGDNLARISGDPQQTARLHISAGPAVQAVRCFCTGGSHGGSMGRSKKRCLFCASSHRTQLTPVSCCQRGGVRTEAERSNTIRPPEFYVETSPPRGVCPK
jgi:hypothetical protein